MALNIYKSGQGYWTRVMTAVGVGTLALGAAAWFNDRILSGYSLVDKNQLMYWQAGIIAGTALLAGALLWWLLNKPRIADFMIATENEMKKVNWPSKQAVIALTWVVIVGTLFIALLLFLSDLGFSQFFQKIGVLQV